MCAISVGGLPVKQLYVGSRPTVSANLCTGSGDGLALVWRTGDVGSLPTRCTNLTESDLVWNGHCLLNRWSLNGAYGSIPSLSSKYANVTLWECNSLSARFRWVRFSSLAPNIDMCAIPVSGLAVNQLNVGSSPTVSAKQYTYSLTVKQSADNRWIQVQFSLGVPNTHVV